MIEDYIPLPLEDCEYRCVGGETWFKCHIMDAGEIGFTIAALHFVDDECDGLQFFRSSNIEFRQAPAQKLVNNIIKVMGLTASGDRDTLKAEIHKFIISES